jgi:hypothetical protein
VEIVAHKTAVVGPLVVDIEPGPSLARDSFLLSVLDRSFRKIAEAEVNGRQEVQLDVPRQFGENNVYRLAVNWGGIPLIDDPRTLNFRVFRVKWLNASSVVRTPPPKDPSSARMALPRETQPATPIVEVEETAVERAEYLHTNACGDFTLMAREHWFDLRGYPEFDLYSFNIDSVLCYAAHHGGAPETMLKEPMRIYHIEHGLGSGWTPEGQAKLFERLRAKGMGWVDYQELVGWAAQMRRLRSPMIFNRENWGLADFELPEMRLTERSSVQRT